MGHPSDDELRKLIADCGVMLHSDKLLKLLKKKIVILNIPIKKRRLAQIVIPRMTTENDIAIIIKHLQLIKKSLVIMFLVLGKISKDVL